MSIQVTPIPRLTTLTTPAFLLGTANTAGDAITAVSSNSTILTYDTSDPAAVSSAAAVGSSSTAARRDHVHAGILQSKLVQFSRTAAAGAGDQAITGAGFTPTTIQIIGMVNDAAFGSWGWGDTALGEACMFSKGTTPVFTYALNCLVVESGSDKMHAVLKTLDADGCTLTWAKTNNGADTYNYILFLR
jgi:hypothetical protein